MEPVLTAASILAITYGVLDYIEAHKIKKMHDQIKEDPKLIKDLKEVYDQGYVVRPNTPVYIPATLGPFTPGPRKTLDNLIRNS